MRSLLVLCCTLFVASQAHALLGFDPEKMYVGADYFASVNEELDDPTGFGGAAGYRFNDRHAVEVEFRNFTGDSIFIAPSGDRFALIDHTGRSLMVNYRYTATLFEGEPYFTYFGAGAGMTKFISDVMPSTVEPRTSSDTTMSFQLFFGVGYDFRNGLILTGGYRLFAPGDPTVATIDVDAGTMHILEIGIDYGF